MTTNIPTSRSPTSSSPSSGTRSSLLRRAREQDASAWCELVDLYGPLVQYWCRRCGLGEELANDCVQEVFLGVSRGLTKFESRRVDGSFRAWLWTITANKARDLQRRENRHEAPGGTTALRSLQGMIDEVSVSGGLAIPDEEPTGPIEISRLLQRAIAQVRAEYSERTWEIFERSVIEGLPTAVVAKQFQVTDATVRQTRSRILRRLRQQLGDF